MRRALPRNTALPLVLVSGLRDNIGGLGSNQNEICWNRGAGRRTGRLRVRVVRYHAGLRIAGHVSTIRLPAARDGGAGCICARVMPDLTTIGVITGIVAGIGGLALGIWNRVEQWREYRARRNARKPHFELHASPHANNEGWRPLQFIFYNPAELSFNVESIEVTTAAVKIAPVLAPGFGQVPYGGMGIAPDTSLTGQTVSVAWTVESGTSPSRSPLHRIFWHPESTPISFSIRVTAREISASRQKIHMQANAIISS
jgi:hypothetical protein